MSSPSGYYKEDLNTRGITGGLDALPRVSKSHGSDLLVLLLDGGGSPLLFLGAVEERGFFSLSSVRLCKQSFQEWPLLPALRLLC